MNFRRRAILCTILYRNLMQASNFGGAFDQLFLWIFLWNFYRRCLSTCFIPWCKKVKNDQKLKSRGILPTSTCSNSLYPPLPSITGYLIGQLPYPVPGNRTLNSWPYSIAIESCTMTSSKIIIIEYDTPIHLKISLSFGRNNIVITDVLEVMYIRCFKPVLCEQKSFVVNLTLFRHTLSFSFLNSARASSLIFEWTVFSCMHHTPTLNKFSSFSRERNYMSLHRKKRVIVWEQSDYLQPHLWSFSWPR